MEEGLGTEGQPCQGLHYPPPGFPGFTEKTRPSEYLRKIVFDQMRQKLPCSFDFPFESLSRVPGPKPDHVWLVFSADSLTSTHSIPFHSPDIF